MALLATSRFLSDNNQVPNYIASRWIRKILPLAELQTYKKWQCVALNLYVNYFYYDDTNCLTVQH